jgi:glycosyltransferase involved in cell wall biosynthesis
MIDESVVSIVIPSYNGGRQLCACLSSVYAQDDPTALEVIVVDDGSTDGSVEAAKEAFPDIVVISTKRRLGCDGARQAGIDRATGQIIANTDADCVVSSTWLRGILSALEAGADAVTGPVIHRRDLLSTLVAITDFPDFQSLEAGHRTNFPGCNFALKRTTIKRYGYHNHTATPNGADRLLSWKMASDGCTLAYEPLAAIHHNPELRTPTLFVRHKTYAKTAIDIRKLDSTLPGGNLARYGRLAAPIYCVARMGKDIGTLAKLAAQRRIPASLAPALLVCAPALRMFDLVFMLASTPGES